MSDYLEHAKALYEGQHEIWPGLSQKVDRLSAAGRFLHEILQLPKKTKFCDLGCGTGQLSFALASNGYHMLGIDFSDALIGTARQMMDTHRIGDDISFVVGDFETYKVSFQPKVVIFWDTTLNIYPLSHAKKVLQHWADQMSPGGKLIIEMINPKHWVKPKTVQKFEPSIWAPGYTERTYTFDAKTSVLTDKVKYRENKNSVVRHLPEQKLHLYKTHDLLKTMQSLGAKMATLYENDGQIYSPKYIATWQLSKGTSALNSPSCISSSAWSLCYEFEF